jgi:hypothetical protein
MGGIIIVGGYYNAGGIIMRGLQAGAAALFALLGVIVFAEPAFSFRPITTGGVTPTVLAPGSSGGSGEPSQPTSPNGKCSGCGQVSPYPGDPSLPTGGSPASPTNGPNAGPSGGAGGGSGPNGSLTSSGGAGSSSGSGSSAGNSSSGNTASGVSTVSVSQSLDDATQQAVQARGSVRAEDDCADGKGREQYRSRDDQQCQHPVRRRQQAQGRVTKAPPPPPPAPPVTYSSWVYGFGDYEVHQNVAPNSGSDVTRRTATGGTLGGFDVTFHGLGAGGDRLILGFMAGYSSAGLTFPGDVLNTRMQISGTSVGGYVKYFSGPFWNESIFKADLFDLSQNQSFFGTDSTPMSVYTIADNFNYRFNVGAGWWEPTAGVQYASTQFGGNAADLLLANGFDWRVQGGLRAGTSFPWNNAIVTTTVTGLAYSDVLIRGFVLDNGLAPTSLPEDAGKVRGEGIVTANLDFQNGVGIFAQGDVRGGRDLLAGGGRLGMRIGW